MGLILDHSYLDILADSKVHSYSTPQLAVSELKQDSLDSEDDSLPEPLSYGLCDEWK